MEQVNCEIQGREAYRSLVRRAAINELERMHQRTTKPWQHLFSRRHASMLLEANTPAPDREAAESYCRFLGVSLESMLSSDVEGEVQRLNRNAERIRLGSVESGFLPLLRSLSLRSWLAGAAVLLPLALFCLWAAAHSFKISGFFEMAATSLVVSVLLLPMVAPVVFGVEKLRQDKLQMQMS